MAGAQMTRIIRPKNWNEFQHYKDRAPAWIKLHKRLLDDYDFQRLPLASRALAPMLWLLASEYENGEIDADDEKLAFRLRVTIKDLHSGLDPLLSAGFFEIVLNGKPVASAMLAEAERGAIPEKRTSNKEQEREEKNNAHASRSLTDFEKFWEAYPKKKSKGQARKAYAKAVERAPPDQILAAATVLRSMPLDKKFIQHPATWLGADGWLDEDLVPRASLDPEKAAAAQDKADRLMRRGKYAEHLQ
jgi:hypothetical protein